MQGIIAYVSGNSAVQYVLDILTISYWLQHRGAWYVAMLIPLYTVFPLMWKTIKKLRHPVFVTLACAVILSYCTYYFKEYGYCTEGVISNCLFVIERLPSFFIGMGISLYDTKTSEKYNWKIVLGTMVLSCIGYVVTAKVGYPIFLSGYAWAALAICVVVSVLLNRLESIAFVQWGKTAFILLGSISLEMYLYNIYLSEIVKMVFSNCNISQWLQYMVVVIIGTVMSCMVLAFRRKRHQSYAERPVV